MSDPEITQAEEAEAISTVRVTMMAGDTVTLDHDPLLTVGDYIDKAGIRPEKGQVVTVNGEPADPTNLLAPNSVIVVANRIANG